MAAVNLHEEFMKTRYVFVILLIGQILFFIVSLLIVENNLVNMNNSLDDVFRIFIPLLGILAMFLANKIYSKRIAWIAVNEMLEEKLRKYRSLKIIQWVLIEAACILSLVGFIITQNYLHTIVFLFLIGYFYLLRPTKVQLKSDMKI